MAFDTVNERRSALNIGLFGLLLPMFIPLESDGSNTNDDGENALGYYVGYDYTGAVPPVTSRKVRQRNSLSLRIGIGL